LPSRSRIPGARPMRSWRSNIRTGDKSSCDAGIPNTLSAMLMSRLISFVPALILSAPSLPSLFDWPGKPQRVFPGIWRSPLESSGKPTVIAGPSSLASVFSNSALGATCRAPRKESGDRWSWLVALAVWPLYLARPIVQGHPLPWQEPQANLTPQRAPQSLGSVIEHWGSPVRSPKVRGKPSGWPQCRPRIPKQRHRVVNKLQDRPATA